SIAGRSAAAPTTIRGSATWASEGTVRRRIEPRHRAGSAAAPRRLTMRQVLTLFLGTFSTLLAIINPLEALPVYLKLLEGRGDEAHRDVARRSCLYAVLLMFFFLLPPTSASPPPRGCCSGSGRRASTPPRASSASSSRRWAWA